MINKYTQHKIPYLSSSERDRWADWEGFQTGWSHSLAAYTCYSARGNLSLKNVWKKSACGLDCVHCCWHSAMACIGDFDVSEKKLRSFTRVVSTWNETCKLRGRATLRGKIGFLLALGLSCLFKYKAYHLQDYVWSTTNFLIVVKFFNTSIKIKS